MSVATLSLTATLEAAADWQLCVVLEDNRAVFTPLPPAEVTGDGWYKGHWLCNATARIYNTRHIEVVYGDCEYETPWNIARAASADQLKVGTFPCLHTPVYAYKQQEPIYAGVTLREFVERIARAGGQVWLPLLPD